MEYTHAVFLLPRDPNIDGRALLEYAGVHIDSYHEGPGIALGYIDANWFQHVKKWLEDRHIVVDESKIATKKSDTPTPLSSDDYHEAYENAIFGPH